MPLLHEVADPKTWPAQCSARHATGDAKPPMMSSHRHRLRLRAVLAFFSGVSRLSSATAVRCPTVLPSNAHVAFAIHHSPLQCTSARSRHSPFLLCVNMAVTVDRAFSPTTSARPGRAALTTSDLNTRPPPQDYIEALLRLLGISITIYAFVVTPDNPNVLYGCMVACVRGDR